MNPPNFIFIYTGIYKQIYNLHSTHQGRSQGGFEIQTLRFFYHCFIGQQLTFVFFVVAPQFDQPPIPEVFFLATVLPRTVQFAHRYI